MSSDDTATERQSDLAVMEANEYKQKRRLERILDAIDGVPDTADEAWSAYVQGEISREAYNIAVQRAVTKAIRECYKLLLNHHRKADERDRYWAGDHEDVLGSVELLGNEMEVLIGLRDFVEAPTFFETTVTETVERRNLPNEQRQRTVETTMPERVSYRAYFRLKEFLDDVHDMEVSFEEMADDELPMITGFDMSDPESNGNGTAESTNVEYNGSPDI